MKDPQQIKPVVAIAVMGVSGSGKTTVGKSLADHLGWVYVEADDFHPAENILKMSQGKPLDDTDRAPWLAALNSRIHFHQKEGQSVVLSCSALKKKYRETVMKEVKTPVWVYLRGDYETISRRINERDAHFMKSTLLDSQFADLEPPQAHEAIIVDIIHSPEEIQQKILDQLKKY